MTVAGSGKAVSVDTAEGDGETEGTGERVALGTVVGDCGTDVGRAEGDGCGEAFATETGVFFGAGVTVIRWHAARNAPRAPKLNPTNLRRDRPPPVSVCSVSPTTSPLSTPTLSSSHSNSISPAMIWAPNLRRADQLETP